MFFKYFYLQKTQFSAVDLLFHQDRREKLKNMPGRLSLASDKYTANFEKQELLKNDLICRRKTLKKCA